MDTPKTKCKKLVYNITQQELGVWSSATTFVLSCLNSNGKEEFTSYAAHGFIQHREGVGYIPVFCSSGILSLTIICITVVLPSGRDRAKGERKRKKERE